MAFVDVDTLETLVEQGYLTARRHPIYPYLTIWNYTPKTQFEQFWTPETRMCRGLITDSVTGRIFARPFPKFFNLEEDDGEVPLEPFEVTEKMDGSLGILVFAHDGEPLIATRGSFMSDQALHATRILRQRYSDFPFDPSKTYLFEIVFRENRIVLDYGDLDDLILLAVIDTETATEVSIHNMSWPFPVAKCYDGLMDLYALRELEEQNKEGFVVRFIPSNYRVKVKFAEYVRLHKILTGVTTKSIWETLRSTGSVNTLLDGVPDEFYQWVRMTEATLWSQYHQIEGYCQEITEHTRTLSTRKEQATFVLKTKYPGIVFSMLDQKNYQEGIWKLIKPDADHPFTTGEAA